MINLNKKIIIGTAQFGSKYGITNQIGELSFSEIKKIVDEAKKQNVNFYDTSPVYGTAEIKLGKCFNNNSKVITKISGNKDNYFDKQNLKKIEKVFLKSLKDLKLKKIYGLLMHSTEDLYKKNNKILIDFLESLKKNNIVEKIGVSIYEKKDLDNAFKIFHPDIIQLPISIADQRLLKNNFLNYIKKMNIEIHARSIFLQGLLVSRTKSLPKNLNLIRNYLFNFNKKLKQNELKPLDACLSFINNIPEIDKFVIGFTSLNEFKEVLRINCKKKSKFNCFDQFKLNNKEILNPSNW